MVFGPLFFEVKGNILTLNLLLSLLYMTVEIVTCCYLNRSYHSVYVGMLYVNIT